MRGYLIDGKQLIAYANWYLSNPLRRFDSGYNDPHDYFDKHNQISKATLMTVWSERYSQLDIKKVHSVIHYAKKHPRLLVYGAGVASSAESISAGGRGFDMGLSMSLEPYSHRYPTLTDGSYAPDYVDALKEQHLVGYIKIIKRVKAINRHIDDTNVKATVFNEACNQYIRNVAKRNHINYSSALLSDTPPILAVEPEAVKGGPSFFQNLINMYCSNDPHYAELFKLNKMTGQVRYRGHFVNAHGSIAYWAAVKKSLRSRINLGKIPHEPAFTKDLNYESLKVVGPNGPNEHISNPREVADYQNYIQK